MSRAAAEMPISDARDHLAEVVNRAMYGGEVTYLTRRGRRLAVVVSEAQLRADETRAREEAIVETCREMWRSVADADEVTRTAVSTAIEYIVSMLEDAVDLTAILAVSEEREAGAQPVSWELAKAEFGL
ncbi:MAG TPA: type II toxin-antitoxin system prevent-host-death family antitoxin [Streptosporangiaceae bacterium]|nr:type II toxin-antitoxin system prevent-host-death family antitoxin [Streptosporangiaceae bacterium]